MTIRTRFFGKKIGEGTLRNLVEAIGEDTQELYRVDEGWSVGNLSGKVRFFPAIDGIDVELVVYRKDFHSKIELPEVKNHSWNMTGKIKYQGETQ